MMRSVIAKRDELVKQLQNEPGFVSVGIAKQKGNVILLVAVDPSFHGSIPETFEGMRVVVEDLGQAESQYPIERSK